MLDRFGKDIPISPSEKEGWSVTSVDVALSSQFLGWIFSLGTNVRIIGPEKVVERYADEIAMLARMYKESNGF